MVTPLHLSLCGQQKKSDGGGAPISDKVGLKWWNVRRLKASFRAADGNFVCETKGGQNRLAAAGDAGSYSE